MADWWQNQKSHLPGDPDCKFCGGQGVIQLEDHFPPLYKSCVCMHTKDILRNVERGLPGLSKARKLKKGVTGEFQGKTNQNLRITAPLSWFRAQLRWVMIRQPPSFWFKVTSDTELMRAWLGTVHLKGIGIIDPDAHQVSSLYMNLEDLIEPPDLLIIHLGVKKARNEASPEVLEETLRIRQFRGKPTWLFNEPQTPFDSTMPSWSYGLESYLEDWDNIERTARKSVQNPTGQLPDLADVMAPTTRGSKPRPTGRRRGLAKNQGSGSAKALDLPEVNHDTRKNKKNSKWRK